MEVLVVDDEPTATDIVEEFFELFPGSVKWNLTICNDPFEGLLVIENDPFDLIILDLHMPGIHGIELLRSFRTAGCIAPVLIASGSILPEDKKRAYDLGACFYLSKPFGLTAFIDAVHNLVPWTLK